MSGPPQHDEQLACMSKRAYQGGPEVACSESACLHFWNAMLLGL